MSNVHEMIGQYLKELRRALHLRQVDAGKIMGLDQSSLSRVENGHQALTVAQWLTFCNSQGLHTSLPLPIQMEIKKR